MWIAISFLQWFRIPIMLDVTMRTASLLYVSNFRIAKQPEYKIHRSVSRCWRIGDKDRAFSDQSMFRCDFRVK